MNWKELIEANDRVQQHILVREEPAARDMTTVCKGLEELMEMRNDLLRFVFRVAHCNYSTPEILQNIKDAREILNNLRGNTDEPKA